MASPHYCQYCYNLDIKNKRRYQDQYWCLELKKYCELKDGYNCRYWHDKFNSSYGFGKSRFISVLGEKLRLNGLLLDLLEIINLNNQYNQEDNIDTFYNNEDTICDNILNIDDECTFFSNIYTNYILPCIETFKNSNMYECIITYQNMLDYLINNFTNNKVKVRKLEG